MSTTDPHHEKHADGIVEDRTQAPPVYFNVLFYGLIAWGAVFIAWFLFSGWSSHGEFAEKMAAHTGTPAAVAAPAVAPATPAPAAPEAGSAAALYAERCAGCHGARGEGGYGPDLTGKSYRYGKTPAAVHESIASGRPKNMPAFAGKLSAAELDALTAYVLQL